MEALKKWGRAPRVKAWGPLLVAVGVGVAVFWEVRAGLAARARGLSDPRYLVAARDLSAGLPVSFSDLSFRFAGDEPVPSGAVTDQELALLADSVWKAALPKGGWVTWAVLAAARDSGLGASTPKGMRAHGIELASGPPVFPKDRIDVFWRSRDPAAAPSLVVEAAQVLRVRREGSSQSVVLAVYPDDIPVLEKAAGNGTLSLSVRNPEETASRSSRSRRHAPSRGSLSPRRVEIWTDKA